MLSYIRKGDNPDTLMIGVFNMTPVPQSGYRIGLPQKGKLQEVFNSDASQYGGTGDYHNKKLKVVKKAWNGKSHSAEIIVPPLAGIVLELNS